MNPVFETFLFRKVEVFVLFAFVWWSAYIHAHAPHRCCTV